MYVKFWGLARPPGPLSPLSNGRQIRVKILVKNFPVARAALSKHDPSNRPSNLARAPGAPAPLHVKSVKFGASASSDET